MRGNYKTIKKRICGKVREFVLMPTYDGDIKELWQEWTEDKEAYYVYSYGKLIEGEFNHRYIGIGNQQRYKKAKRENQTLAGNMRDNEYYKIIVCKCDNREGAAAIEQNLIGFFGRKDIGTGDLYNLTDGGELGIAGYTHTEETRAKMSAAKSGENHPNYGKTYSDEHRAKISAAKTKDKSHLTDEVLFKYLQSSKSWQKEVPADWGLSYRTIPKILQKRYGSGSAVKAQKILAEKLRKRVLNHANFIEYCKFHKYEFLQMANYYFGISGEQLQRWAARTYKSAKTQTIDGWEKQAKELERIRKYKIPKKRQE